MICAIVQARMGSQRFPGKMMEDLDGHPIIWYVFHRLSQCKRIDKIVLATGVSRDNDPLVEFVESLGIKIYRGDNTLLIERYYHCAKYFSADTIIRVTGDCPLIDPVLTDSVVELFEKENADYASNVHPPTYPDGLDVEVFSFDALETAWKEARIDSDREHVTPYLWTNKGLFRCVNLRNSEDYSYMRLTVDYERDLSLLRKIAQKIQLSSSSWQTISVTVRSDPHLFKFNSDITRNEGYADSISQDVPKNKKSREILDFAKKHIPSASQTYSKSYRHVADPLILERGSGAYVWDVDGNRYVDFVCGLGAIILGYNDPGVSEAAMYQITRGVTFSQPTELESQLTGCLLSLFPWADMVRFMKNGSDVTSAAVRLTRAATDREVIACCGYHGFQDWYIGTTSNNAGVPISVQNLSFPFKYNDMDSLQSIFDENPGNVAGIIMEPCQGNGPNCGFLEDVRQISDQYGSLLVFDEVLSGFRIPELAFHNRVNVTPDLVTFGKAIANGFPLSVLMGRGEIMQLLEDSVFVSTTFGGEALSLAAAIATIDALSPNVLSYISELGSLWLKAMSEMIRDKGLAEVVTTIGMTPHCGVSFYKSHGVSEWEYLSIYQEVLSSHGVLSLGVNNFCLAHTKKDVGNHLSAASDALDSVQQAFKKKSVEGILKAHSIVPVFRRSL